MRGWRTGFLILGTLMLLAAFPSRTQPQNISKSREPNSQTLVLDGMGKGTADLGGLWQFHLGDDLQWAQPGFDDSQWKSLLVDAPWGAQGYPSYTGFAWYRRHIDIVPEPGASGQYRILIPDAEDAYEVYWNGHLVGSYGHFPPHAYWYYTVFPRSFPIHGGSGGVLAIRIWKAPLDIFSLAESGGIYSIPTLGDPDSITLYEHAILWSEVQQDLFDYSLVLLRLFIAVLCVVLWTRSRKEQLFLWVGVFTVTPVGLGILQNLFFIPFSYELARGINQPLYVLSNISLWFLLVWLLRLNENPRILKVTDTIARITLIVGLLDGMLALFWGNATLWMQWADGILATCILLSELYPFALIFLGLRKHLDASRWAVAGTAFLVQMIRTIADASALGQRFTHWTLYSSLIDNNSFQIQGVVFTPEKIASLALFAAIVYAVYRYVIETQARRTALEQEMQSAREIQQVLIPETLPSLEGFAVTSAYTPAQEVGGDFFQILANPDGSTIVAIGDVSGKGLKAAMNVSMIVGVIRAETAASTSPQKIVSALNQCLVGRMQGGFATGIVFRLDPDGTVTLSNAGHLPPYLNGQELSLEPSLPLGLIKQTDYHEVAVCLQPGDQLSLYTDGLLEARNEQGELFGFDRMNKLFATRPTAQQASETAVAFGQEDDITILTLTRLAAGQESSTQLVAPGLARAS
jgi:hypothetical protein